MLPERVEKWLPDLLGVLRAHPLECERQLEDVVAPDLDLLPPVLVAQPVAIERDEALEQLLERRVALRGDLAADVAEVVGQRVRHERHPGDHAERAAAAAAQRPEQLDRKSTRLNSSH